MTDTTMAKFRFYQDKEVKTWVRDYYNVEADTLSDAIKQIQDAKKSLEDLECDSDNVEYDYRDVDVVIQSCEEDYTTLCIFSCDLENEGKDGDILTLGKE